MAPLQIKPQGHLSILGSLSGIVTLLNPKPPFVYALPPTSCAVEEKIFCNILPSAAKHNIPAGHHQNFVPGFPHEAALLSKQRDDRRCQDPLDPVIPQLSDEITKIVCDSARKEWIDKMESDDIKSNLVAHWSLIKKLSGILAS
jgi:hypothetical protein